MSSVSSPYTPLKGPMGLKAPPLADDESHSEVSIYITFHADKKYSHPPNHPHSLNAMITSFLANESKVPDVLYVDHGQTNGVIAGRMVELFAQARPESHRPDIKRFPYPSEWESDDEEAMDRDEMGPQFAKIRQQLRQLTTRYRSIMVIVQRDFIMELADMRGWNIVYERIRFLQDHEISEMKVNGMPTISEDYGPDVLVKY